MAPAATCNHSGESFPAIRSCRYERFKHRTYVSVPRSLDQVKFEPASFRSIWASQDSPSLEHRATTCHRLAASRATDRKSHSPLAVFAACALMTRGAPSC